MNGKPKFTLSISLSRHREKYTLELLSKFKNKLEKVKEKEEISEGESSKPTTHYKAVNDNNDDDIVGGEWIKKILFRWTLIVQNY